MSRGVILPGRPIHLGIRPSGLLFIVGRLYEMALRYFLGQDAFISYSRSDAFDYAGSLASLLAQKGFTVFCDQAGTPPGSSVPREVLRNARLASVMVVLGSPAALGSPNVLEELNTFGRTGRSLIPVLADSDGTSPGPIRIPAGWQPYIEGLSISSEPLERIRRGQPSNDIQRRIALAVGVNTQKRRIQRATRTAIAVFSLLLTGSALTAWQLERSMKRINKAQTQLSTLSNDIRTRETDLQKTQKDLVSAQGQLSRSRDELKKLSELANQEKARLEDQRAAAAQVWRSLLPQLQQLLPQPSLACENGQLVMKPALVINMQVNWPIDGGPPKWPGAVQDLLKKLAERYFACYPQPDKQPVLEVGGHVGSRMTRESDEIPYAIAPGTSLQYGLQVGEIYANWVAEALNQMGIPKDKIRIISYGKEKPVVLGDLGSDEGMGRELLNNRVEITLR